jgi:hypothetical protein
VDRGENLVVGPERIAVAPVGTDRRRWLIIVGLACLAIRVRIQRRCGVDLVARLALACVARVLLLAFTFAVALAFAIFGRLRFGFAFLVLFAFLVGLTEGDPPDV